MRRPPLWVRNLVLGIVVVVPFIATLGAIVLLWNRLVTWTDIALLVGVDGNKQYHYLQDPDVFYPFDQWVHVYVEFDPAGPTFSAYRNGTPLAGFNMPNGPGVSITPQASQKLMGGLTGELDLVRIYGSPAAGLATSLARERRATTRPRPSPSSRSRSSRARP